MELNLTTPAVLFPAISLLMLAYTNRYLAIASLIRDLYSEYKNGQDEVLLQQMTILRYRIRLIRNMQFYIQQSVRALDLQLRDLEER